MIEAKRLNDILEGIVSEHEQKLQLIVQDILRGREHEGCLCGLCNISDAIIANDTIVKMINNCVISRDPHVVLNAFLVMFLLGRRYEASTVMEDIFK